MLYRAMGRKQSPYSMTYLEKALAVHKSDDDETLETLKMIMFHCDDNIKLVFSYEKYKKLFSGERRKDLDEDYGYWFRANEELAEDRKKEKEKKKEQKMKASEKTK